MILLYALGAILIVALFPFIIRFMLPLVAIVLIIALIYTTGGIAGIILGGILLFCNIASKIER